jgi:hypothetical protein
VQNTGHADLVQRPDGSWALVYHGVRPRGSSPEWHVLGRETFADEVEWRDGWPVVTGHVEPAAPADAVFREELADDVLPPSWVAASAFPEEVVTRTEGGRIVRPAGDRPAFLGRRQEHLYARVRARVAVDGTGGLSVRIDPRHALDLEVGDGVVRAVWAVGDVRHVLGERPVAGEAVLGLRMAPTEGHEFSTARGPDRVLAGIEGPEGFDVLGEVDGRYLSTEVAGGMTGRLVGVWCSGGSVVLRSFEYEGSDDPAVVGGGPAGPEPWAR